VATIRPGSTTAKAGSVAMVIAGSMRLSWPMGGVDHSTPALPA
jgi:hypothetical protein